MRPRFHEFILAALLVLSFGPTVWFAAPAGAQSPTIGVVKFQSGAAEIRRGGTVLPASIGQELHLGDELRTAADGSLGIALDDGTLISIGHDSIFVVEVFQFAPSRGLFEFVGRLFQGRLIYESGLIEESAPEKVRIETPFATVGTRGTRFALSVGRGAAA